MWITMAPISKRKCACFYIYTKQKMRNVYIYIPKSRYFSKIKTICPTFYSQKARHFTISSLMKIMKLADIYIQKLWQFINVTFLYTKSQKLRKSNTICVTFYIYKKLDTLRYATFVEILKLAERRWEIVLRKTNALCLKFVYAKNNALSITFLYTKIQTPCVTFL